MERISAGNSILNRRQLLASLLLLVAASPMLIPLMMICNYGVNSPYWDQWDIASIFIKSHDHTLRFVDLYAQHNEHRILIPRLLFLLLASMTSWNVLVEMLAEWLIACATSIGVLVLLHRTRRCTAAAVQSPNISPEWRTPLTWFLCNLLIFSPSQWENWLSGLGLINVLPMFFIMAMILLIGAQRRGWLTIAGVILLCLAASYSAGNGLLAWPIAMVLLACSESIAELKQKIPHLAALSAAMLLTIWIYFTGYHAPILQETQPADAGIAQLIHYNLVFAGNPFISIQWSSTIAITTISGAVLFLLMLLVFTYLMRVWISLRDYAPLHAALPWIAIGGFSIASGLLASLSRARLGLDQALTSRYVTFSLYLSVAMVVLVPLVCRDVIARYASGSTPRQWLFRAIPIGLGAGLVLATLVSIPNWISDCQLFNFIHVRGKAALLLINIVPDNPHLEQAVYPQAKFLQEQAKRINELGYLDPPLISSRNAARIAASTAVTPRIVRGALEHYASPAKGIARVNGFALFADKHAAADTVFLTATGAAGEPIIFTVAENAVERGDVAEKFGDPRYLLSGWQAVFSVGRLPGTEPSLLIEAWALDSSTGKAYRLGGSFTATR